ncbi:MAG: transporter substrate-binding protein, partial [Paenibacillus sp.]|nr:transporter substrate-binding protein [Paenibacillus sp.]
MSRKRPLWRPMAILVIVAAILGSGDLPSSVVPAYAEKTALPASTTADKKTPVLNNELGAYYLDVLTDWMQKGYKPTTQAAITIPGAALTSQADAKLAAVGSYEGKSGVLVWKSDRDNWIEYEVDVPQEGLYEMSMSYHPYNDPDKSGLSANRHPAILALQIDGLYPYREARALTFRRKFKDDFPVKKAENGDDIRPRPIELSQWMNESMIDSAGGYSEPFQWYLTKGKHKLRFTGSSPIVIESFDLKPPAVLPDYKTVSMTSSYKQTDSAKDAVVPIVQAEQAAWKNDVAIQMVTNQDSMNVPKANGYAIFNSLGGNRWQTGGQTAAWTIDVPETGLYRVAIRLFQGYASNKSVFRTIAIDGKVPFKELLAYRFPYSIKWKGTVLGDENDKPFEFYLQKGTHTLSMTATIGPFQPVIVQGERVISLLRQVDEAIRAMNGGLVDKNRTWKVREEFPELPQQMEEAKVELQKMADIMLAVNKQRDNTIQTIETTLQDLNDYLKHPNEIPYHMDDVSSMIERIGGIREVLVRSPLLLDQIYTVPSGKSIPKMEANLWQRMSNSFQNFIYSFIRKDDINKVDGDT